MARGDVEFAEFVRVSSARLLRAAYLLTGDRHQAEDDVQTALVKTFASWGRIRRQDPFAYTRRVLANHVIDRWRRPFREDATEELPERTVVRDFTDGVVTQEWLMRELAELSARERAVVVLRHFCDLSEADVAAELKVSLGTVKSTNSRALAKMRVAAGPGLLECAAGRAS
ncbi:SigE family RNA polymerase sigma factor [Amycolatopsis saalfeldensis]|uniref:RNA polymerase sigma-70 factor, sigma-E family n=1 Tax=Amycolatopsis saalfeldensis TaxID=394193 RepID=A0A1H8TF96_9PSEU|nr:SigE family RNA polymerase sigma factor [Amycolatopsis saalfeldensis]SEO89426.1 RNA polymerase sigma-70 factor, sigma-E family [Amycolatopsis saalfeldensis]